MPLNPMTVAWRRYKGDRWKGRRIVPEFVYDVRKAFMSGYRAAERERKRVMEEKQCPREVDETQEKPWEPPEEKSLEGVKKTPTLDHFRVRARAPWKSDDKGMTFWPSLGNDVSVFAVLSDKSEIDITHGITSVTWEAKPGEAPEMRFGVLAPEMDVYGLVEHEQLEPGEKVKRRIGMMEQAEKDGLPRYNFGARFRVVLLSEYVNFDNLDKVWGFAWYHASGHNPNGQPSCPISLEGMNRLLEKRRRALDGAPVKIQEWVDGEWIG